MHTTTCTRANSAKSAVREIIQAQLNEIGNSINEFENKFRKERQRVVGLEKLYKQIETLRNKAESLRKAVEGDVKNETAIFASRFAKKRDRLCDLRREVLFANAAKVREMYEELKPSKAEGRTA